MTQTTRRSRSRIPLVIGLAAVAAVALGALVAFGVAGGPSAPAPAAGSGQAAPEVTFERWDGSPGSLADYRGTPLVLNFWASWCPPCAAEMPGFEQVHQEFRGEVAFLGLDLQDDPAAAQALVDRTGVTYDLGVDQDGGVFRAFGGIGMPTTVFISAEGEILDRHTGILTERQLAERIETLLLGS